MKKRLYIILLFVLALCVFIGCNLDNSWKDYENFKAKLDGTWFRNSGTYTYTYVIKNSASSYEYSVSKSGQVESKSSGDLRLNQKESGSGSSKEYYYELTFMPVGENSFTYRVKFETDTRLELGYNTYTKN